MNNNIYSKKNHFYLTILSIAFTVFFFNEQVAVRGGLVISGEVIYQDNISPLKIENLLTSSKMIDQAIVYGDNKPYLVALLILNEEYSYKEENLEKELENLNKNLTKVEKIKKFFIIKENFTIENGMMTPTLKLKRFKIINKYKNEFENLY